MTNRITEKRAGDVSLLDVGNYVEVGQTAGTLYGFTRHSNADTVTFALSPMADHCPTVVVALNEEPLLVLDADEEARHPVHFGSPPTMTTAEAMAQASDGWESPSKESYPMIDIGPDGKMRFRDVSH